MADGSSCRSPFDLAKEQLFNFRGKSRQDIRCSEDHARNEERTRQSYQNQNIETDAEPFNTDELKTALNNIRSSDPVENSYHSSTTETNISEEFDQTKEKELPSGSGIIVNHETIVKDHVDICEANRSDAVAVENSFHGSSVSEERDSSLGGVYHNTAVKAPSDVHVQTRSHNSAEAAAEAVENSYHGRCMNEERNIGLDTTDLSSLKERIHALEEDNRELKQRLDQQCASDEVIQQNVARIEEEGQRQNNRNSDELKSLQEQLEQLVQKIKKLEKENDRLKQSVRFPRTVDEWLGKSTENIAKTVLNEKLITYFSKAFNVRYLGIIGSYLGFTDHDIYCIKQDSNGTSRESCRLLLKYWYNRMGDTATVGCLLRSLYRVVQSEPACVDKHCLDDAINKASNSSL